MTSVTDTTAATTTAATTATTTGIGADFNLFLKLLTTQMQNQDPLKPMDSTEYTQQLVQYSQVEQTVQQTGTLKDILAKFSTQDIAQASNFIGREASFDSSTSGLGTSGSASWGYAGAEGASAVVATIKDSTGRIVTTRSLDPTTDRFDWDGNDSYNQRANAGSYKLSISAVDSSGYPVPVTITSIGKVSEVSSGTDGVSLGVNGIDMPMSSLIKVKSAE